MMNIESIGRCINRETNITIDKNKVSEALLFKLMINKEHLSSAVSVVKFITDFSPSSVFFFYFEQCLLLEFFRLRLLYWLLQIFLKKVNVYYNIFGDKRLQNV